MCIFYMGGQSTTVKTLGVAGTVLDYTFYHHVIFETMLRVEYGAL